jgi:hypothetical protein
MAEQVIPYLSLTNCSPLAAEVKLGPERIGARTDDGLQILLHRYENFVAWDWSYYEIALEVYILFQRCVNLSQTLLQSKNNKEDGSEDVSEVTADSIHAGQIFAEMLRSVCHLEFFDHADVEVPASNSIERGLTIGIRDIHSPYFFPIISLCFPATLFTRIIA